MHRFVKNNTYWGKYLGWLLVFVLAAWVLRKIIHTLTLFGLAVMISYLLYPMVAFISKIKIPFIKKKIPWIVSILIVYVLLISIMVIAGVILIPSTIDQINTVLKESPKFISQMQDMVNQLEDSYNRFDLPQEIKERIDDSLISLTNRIGNALGSVFTIIGNVLLNLIQWIMFFILSMIIAFFILSNFDDIKNRAFSLIPFQYQDEARDLINEINTIFGNYVRGNVILVFINGTITYSAIHLVILILQCCMPSGRFPIYDYALVTSVIAGLTYFIPYLGCSLSVIVGFFLAILQTRNLTYGITIALIVLIVNQTVDQFIRPKVLGQALGVSTLFIVLAALAGTELMGVWGLLIGIPTAVMLISIGRFIYKRFLTFEDEDEDDSEQGENRSKSDNNEDGQNREEADSDVAGYSKNSLEIPEEDSDNQKNGNDMNPDKSVKPEKDRD